MAGRGTDIKLTEETKALGGLCVIGTERHESRRIDNQLRGRAGRQGDPGESQFFVSMEDDLYNTSELLFLEGLQNKFGISAEKRRDLISIVYAERDLRERASRIIKE